MHGQEGCPFMFHQQVFKKVVSAGLNSLQQKGYQIVVKTRIFDNPFPKKGQLLVILVEASQYYFFEKWLMKHKWVALVIMQPESDSNFVFLPLKQSSKKYLN